MTDPQALLERVDMIAGHALSLIDRADCLERVARELRTEAGGALSELAELRRDLGNGIVLQRVRRHVRRHLEETRQAKGAA